MSSATGVFVLGMHRSGTSAVTRIVNLLGVPLGDPADLMPATAENSEGYWESLSLTARNDEVLARLGGTWSGPPDLAPGWEKDPRLDELRERARATFRSVYATPTWVWKDPRNCLTLPFWTDLLGVDPTIILVWRNPLEVWRSLEKRSGMTKALAVALWERYSRSALALSAGKTTFAIRYDALLAEPDRWGTALAEFLADRGFAVDRAGGAAAASSFLRADLRHATYGAADAAADPDLSDAQRVLGSCFDAGLGPHARFTAPVLPPETPWTAPLLRERARGDLVERALEERGREIEGVRAELAGAVAEIRRLEASTARLLDWTDKLVGPLFEERAAPAETSPPPYGLDATEDVARYRSWIAASAARAEVERAEIARRLAAVAAPIRVSLVVARPRGTADEVRRCVASLRAQIHGAWELCVAAPGSELRGELEALARDEPRIRIDARATGDFVAAFDLDATLEPEALAEIALAAAEDATVDVVFTDEDELDGAGERLRPLLKPDWSPDLVATGVYPGRLTAVRGGLAEDADELDLLLRATERARKIVHVAKVLAHGAPRGHDAESTARALRAAIARRGIDAAVEPGLVAGTLRVRRRIRGRPKVSLIIPFRDGADLTERCLRSIRETASGIERETILVDNRSSEPETRALLTRLAEGGCRILDHPEPFNWAAINDRAAKEATGDLLLFLNNDVEARTPGWLEALVAEAQAADVGAVGARLLYPYGGVQHAGIVLGMGGFADHAFRHCPADRPGYAGWAKTTRDVAAVTGACLMVRREVFEAAGGFDESLPFTFNDIDFCLRLRERGLRVVYTPYAELVHHESVTRGLSRDLSEKRAMFRRWSRWILRDPFFHPMLSLRRTEFTIRGADEVEPWNELQSMLES